eukprot:Opistho-2@53030
MVATANSMTMPNGRSSAKTLQLQGVGRYAEDFTWEGVMWNPSGTNNTWRGTIGNPSLNSVNSNQKVISPFFLNEIAYPTATSPSVSVEIAGPPGQTLFGWTVALYNGVTGKVQASSGALPAGSNVSSQTSPSSRRSASTTATPSFQSFASDAALGLYVVTFDVPAATATLIASAIAVLDDLGRLVQFVAYSMQSNTTISEAVDGPAAGYTATFVGTFSLIEGMSLQAGGVGFEWGSFALLPPAPPSLGAPNPSQTLAYVCEGTTFSESNEIYPITPVGHIAYGYCATGYISNVSPYRSCDMLPSGYFGAFTSRLSGAESTCVLRTCPPGYINTNSTACVACPSGTYSPDTNARRCLDCPRNALSPSNSTKIDDCACLTGFRRLATAVASINGTDSGTISCLAFDASDPANSTSVVEDMCQVHRNQGVMLHEAPASVRRYATPAIAVIAIFAVIFAIEVAVVPLVTRRFARVIRRQSVTSAPLDVYSMRWNLTNIIKLATIVLQIVQIHAIVLNARVSDDFVDTAGTVFSSAGASSFSASFRWYFWVIMSVTQLWLFYAVIFIVDGGTALRQSGAAGRILLFPAEQLLQIWTTAGFIPTLLNGVRAFHCWYLPDAAYMAIDGVCDVRCWASPLHWAFLSVGSITILVY